jgi:WD40 repeat protein
VLLHTYPDQGPNIGAYQRIIFSPDGSNVATVHGIGGEDGGALYLWSASTGYLRRAITIGSDLKWPHHCAGPAAFSPDGEVFATSGLSQAGALEFFRVKDLDKIATWEDFAGQVAAVAFAPDGRQVVIRGPSGKTWVCNRQTGETVLTFTISDVGVAGGVLGLSPDGKTLALNTVDAVALVQVKTGKTLCALPFPHAIRAIHELTFSGDGNVLITCVQHSIDKTWHIYLWRINLPGHSG